MALVFVGALILILPLWYIWDWWTDGTLAGSEAIALSAVLFATLGQMAVFRDRTNIQHALFLILLASAALLPFLSTTLEKVADRKFRDERMAAFRRTIAADPTNTAARVQLAETLYNLDRLDEAIAELEAAFGVSRLTFRESQILIHWKEEKRIRDSRNIVCPMCRKENERGSETCLGCDRPLAKGFAADWARSGGPAAAVRAWALAIVCLLVVLLVLAMFPGLPSPHPILITLIGFGAWIAFYVGSRRSAR